MKHLKKFNESSHIEWRINLNSLIEDLVSDIQDEGFQVYITDETKSTAYRPSFRIRIKYDEPIIYHETNIDEFKKMNQKVKDLIGLVEELLQRLLNTNEFTLSSASLNGDNKQFLIVLKGKE